MNIIAIISVLFIFLVLVPLLGAAFTAALAVAGWLTLRDRGVAASDDEQP
ncbi:MAG TPA: hypothetical protein VHV31_01610 [Nitrolancea sp.]|nr:hypothetical protein [Nitrolancea sp.]